MIRRQAEALVAKVPYRHAAPVVRMRGECQRAPAARRLLTFSCYLSRMPRVKYLPLCIGPARVDLPDTAQRELTRTTYLQSVSNG